MQMLWVWTWIHFGASSGMAVPGISALMECRMPKFLLQTSAFLWLKHQSDYTQHFSSLPYPDQADSSAFLWATMLHWQLIPNLVYTLVSWVIILFRPSFLCALDRNRHSRSEPKLSSTHHPSPWPVTKTFRQRVQEQDKLIADTSLFLSPSFQPASAASPCSAERLCLQPWPRPASLSASSSLWPGADQPHGVKQDIVQEVLHRNLE